MPKNCTWTQTKRFWMTSSIYFVKETVLSGIRTIYIALNKGLNGPRGLYSSVLYLAELEALHNASLGMRSQWVSAASTAPRTSPHALRLKA